MMMAESAPSPASVISVRARSVGLGLAASIVALTVASMTGQIFRYRLGHDHVFGLVNLFNLDGEMNLPTWYASTTLLAASLLLALNGLLARAAGERDARYWLGLSAIFFYISADETAFIHELLNPLLRQAVFLPGLLYYGWVMAGIVAVAAVAALYARFVLRLAGRVRQLVVLAALLYVGGALGVEMLGARHAYLAGTDNLEYALITTLEESLEMAGVAVFIYALLVQLASRGPVCLRAG